MRPTLILLLALPVLAPTCKKNQDDRAGLVLESDFEGAEPYTGWENNQHCCDYSVAQTHDKFSHGQNALRLEVRSTDPQTSGSIRSELVQEADPVGAERWYGFNMFLENWSDDEAGEHVFQWHPGNLTGTATAALWTSGGRYVFVTNAGGPNSPNEYNDIGPVISNQWVAWVIHVKWASDNSGLLQVWKNGELMINKNRVVTAPNSGTYFKLGINKFGWGIQPSTSTQRVLYFDEVRIANSKGSYEDVRPGL